MQTLLLFSHTFWQDSKVNKLLLKEAAKLPQVKIHNLTEVYSDLSAKINIEAELALLRQADRIVLQFPLFWFSIPALLKEWEDIVLTDIIYSPDPHMLKGKKFAVITTAGGDKASYDGHHGYAIDTLLSPIYYSFEYCGCIKEETLCIYNASAASLPIKDYIAKLQ